MSTSSLLLRWLPLLAIFIVIAHYFWFLESHATNIPFQDDIPDFLQFITQVDNTDSVGDAFEAGFRPYNDHRVGASRLLVYGAYLMKGEVNFRSLILLANLALPLILLLFYLGIEDKEYRWVFLLVSTLLLFNLKYYSIPFMSQAAFAYYFVFLYGFACIFTLHRVNKVKFVLAAVFCTFSSLTLAPGQIVWLLGLASLSHQCLLSGRRSLWYPVVWLLIAIVMVMIWYQGFSDTNVGGQISPFTSYTVEAPLLQILQGYTTFFLSFTGSALINFSVFWAAVAGSAMLVLLVYLSIRSIRHDDIRLLLCCWFAVAAIAATTVGRSILTDVNTMLHIRYNFFSVMLLCSLVLLTLNSFAVFRTYKVYMIVVLALLYSVSTWRYSQDMLQKELNALYSAFNLGRYPVVYMTGYKSKAIIKEAISKGIYKPPCRPFPACENAVEH